MLDQPAQAEYKEQPEVDAQQEDIEVEAASGQWLRVAKWTWVSAAVVVEIAWLVTGAYLLRALLGW